MLLKRFVSYLLASLLSLTGIFALAPILVSATIDTCTWTGTTNSNFNTSTNWSCSVDGTAVPGNGDSLVFPTTATNKTLNNDIASLTVANITFSGAASQLGYTISGNALTLTNGITFTVVGGPVYDTIATALVISGNQTINLAGQNLSLSGVLSGSGNINSIGTGSLNLSGNNTTYSGAITMSAGTLTATGDNALGATSAGTTISAGADLFLNTCNPTLNVPENITFTGNSSNTSGDFPTAKLTTSANGCAGGGGGSTESYGYGANTGSVTLSGNLTLGSDITFASYSATTTATGVLSGNFAFNLLPGYSGNLVLNGSSNGTASPNGTLSSPLFKKTLSDSQASNTVSVNSNTEITIDGTRSDVTVASGGVLKGTGTVGILTVAAGGKVAPGHSPGCMNTNNLTLAGSLDEELGGTTACSEYDQLKVTGTVDVTNGTLNTILYNGFKPVKSQTYKIIDNDGSDAVIGTFKNLPEGTTFTVNGYVLKISYVGGDGNDVVLTVQSVPTTPNTGFKLILNNPLLTVISTTTLAGAILIIAKNYKRFIDRR